MCFGQNDLPSAEVSQTVTELPLAETLICKYCDKPASMTGWTLWLPYDQLPDHTQGQMQTRYGPKIVSVLENRWEFDGGQRLRVLEEDLLDGEGGGGSPGRDPKRRRMYWPSV